MSTNFPTSLDSFATLTDNVEDVLSSHQNNRADAIEAIEAKIGIDSSAVVTSLDYLLTSASSEDPGHCFDEETEILTQRGWLKYPDLSRNDNVLTLNKTSRLLEWNKINEIFVYDHFKELYKIDGINFDLLVTGGHGLVAMDGDDIDLFTADDLYNNPINKNFVIPDISNMNYSVSKFNGEISKVEYDGIVWCVNVDNGTLIVRRNGKVCITQNTHSVYGNFIAAGRKLFLYENTSPTGWTTVAVTDSVLAVKGGSNAYNVTGGQTAGTWTWPSTTLSIAQMPSHDHTGSTLSWGSEAGDATGYVEITSVYSGTVSPGLNIAAQGGGTGHSHGSTTYRPLAAIGIISEKDA